jgi:hypothetical protein
MTGFAAHKPAFRHHTKNALRQERARAAVGFPNSRFITTIRAATSFKVTASMGIRSSGPQYFPSLRYRVTSTRLRSAHSGRFSARYSSTSERSRINRRIVN